jgi:hypothetical protein
VQPFRSPPDESAVMDLRFQRPIENARFSFMNERYIKWYTPLLGREFEMLVFGEKRGLPLIP